MRVYCAVQRSTDQVNKHVLPYCTLESH